MNLIAFADPIFDPGGIASRPVVSTAQVRQAEYLHDAAIITLRGADMSLPELQPGTPVQMQYGWYNTRLDTFYGYIDHVENHFERNTSDAAHYHDVVCLGVSYIMKDAYTGSWNSMQASTLVRQVATSYLLSALVETDDTVWPQLACPGDSAWCFMVDLAQKLGYTFACNKSLLRFNSVDQALKQNWNTMPVFQNQKSANSTAFETMVEFKSLQGEASGINGSVRAARSAGGVDLRTGQVITIANDYSQVTGVAQSVPYPFFRVQETGTVVNDQIQGLASLAGLAQQNRFHYQAYALLAGDPTVVQGVPIVLTGLGTKDSGVWWVQEVCHQIRSSAYTMAVLLGRDSSGDTGSRPTGSYQTVYSPNDPLTLARVSSPPTTLVQNRWRAAFQTITQVTS